MQVDRPKLRLGLAAVCCALVAAPFLSVRFPPISDLPQHVAQIRLFLDAVGNPESIYKVQWLTPYSLAYAIVGACWAVVGPENAGRIAMLLLGVLWTVVAHCVAAGRRRPAEAAVLASALFFNPSTYWGFASFLIGWPVFLFWTTFVVRPPERGFGPRDATLLVATSFLLYFSHALWLAAGLAWLAADTALYRASPRVLLARFASVLPATALAVVWYTDFRVRFATATVWLEPPWERLSPEWLASASFGGPKGPIEYAALAGVAAWIGLGLWQSRRTLRTSADGPLVACGLVFLAAAFLLPYKYQNTILFSTRWLAPAIVLFLLGLPPPSIAPRLLLSWAMALLAALCLATALVWSTFERVELAGLGPTLDAVPVGVRVLGLDFQKESPTIRGRPFLQTFSYAQALRGGRLSFSFAEFAPMLVVFETPQPHPWTAGLEWAAERATPDDIQHFDYVIANGPDDILAFLGTRPDLEPVTTRGRFRLYRVRTATSPPAAAPN